MSEPKAELLLSLSPGKYKIELRGRGEERGVHKITKTQFEYWDDNEDLDEALNGDYDYEENNVPKRAQLPYEYYNDYTDCGFWFGADTDCWVVITDEHDNEIISQQYSEFLDTIHGDDWEPGTEEVEEFYLEYSVKPGYYLVWTQGGKGTYFEGQLKIPEGEVFDLRKIKFETVDWEGNSMIRKVLYKGEEVENYGGDWSGKYSEYAVYQVDKKK